MSQDRPTDLASIRRFVQVVENAQWQRNADAFLALFAHANFDAKQTGDFTTAVWSKLCLNSAGAPCAVLLKPNGIAHHDGVARLMRDIVRECVAVGRAEGATLADSMPDEIVERIRRSPRDSAPADSARAHGPA